MQLASGAPETGKGWRAKLELALARAGDRTELVRRRHEGPLYVQRAFRPHGEQALHVYLLHPPGGLVGGDRLEIEITLGHGASALITTPAAQKLYRSQGAEASQSVRLVVQPGALLEWFPGETIAFDCARARLDTSVELLPGAAFCGWDIACLGRPTLGEVFRSGKLRSTLTLLRDKPLLVERLLIEGSSPVLREGWGLSGHAVYGTFLALGANPARAPEACELLRRDLGPFAGQCAATAFDGILVLRALGSRCDQMRELFVRAWTLLRPLLFGVPASAPRIWST